MKKMLPYLILAPLVGWVVACIVYRRRANREPVKPFCGHIESIRVASPKYTDSTRIGTRIDFMLRLWGTGEEKTKIKSITASVTANGFNMYTRPLLRQNPVRYNYVFHKGVNVPFDVCMYLDDIKPQDVDADSIIVEIEDYEGHQHLICKKPGVKTVWLQESGT